jgi:hypothetical protein
MVERQLRRAFEGKPTDGGGVVGRPRLQFFRVDFRKVSDADDAAARIAIRIAKGMQLLEFPGSDAGLLE